MKLFLIILVWLAASFDCNATIYNSDGSSSDVQTKITGSSSGDTVTIPAGTFHWTTQASVTAPANLTLKGAGTSATGGGDQTVIIDDYASANPLMLLTISTTGTFRMTGITVQSGTGTTKDNGTITIGQSVGTSPANVRVDHCHLNPTSASNYKIILLASGVFGVMDHCVLDLWDTNAVYLANGRVGANDVAGDYEWTLPTNFGGSDSFYIEDCIVNGHNGGDGTLYQSRICDGWSASKIVVRFCTFYQSCVTDTHATGHSSGDDRGWRSQEVYGNSATTSAAALVSSHGPNNAAVHVANGTALVWGNSWDQCYKSIYLIDVTRANNATYTQVATPNGWGYAGTQSGLTGAGSNWDGGTVNATDTLYGYPVIDQPGRGQGDRLIGTFATPNRVNQTTGTIHWPNQASEPVYLWNNSGSNVAGWSGNQYQVDENRVAHDRDYFRTATGIQTTSTSPFDGTTGTGWGTKARRPTTCTTGVAYWATDEGSWNTSSSNPYGVQQSGASGNLYKCTATNTWTLYYTPYTYPHPFQGVTGGITHKGRVARRRFDR